MKKIIELTLVLVMCLVFGGCSKDNDNGEIKFPPATKTTEATTEAEKEEVTAEELVNGFANLHKDDALVETMRENTVSNAYKMNSLDCIGKGVYLINSISDKDYESDDTTILYEASSEGQALASEKKQAMTYYDTIEGCFYEKEDNKGWEKKDYKHITFLTFLRGLSEHVSDLSIDETPYEGIKGYVVKGKIETKYLNKHFKTNTELSALGFTLPDKMGITLIFSLDKDLTDIKIDFTDGLKKKDKSNEINIIDYATAITISEYKKKTIEIIPESVKDEFNDKEEKSTKKADTAEDIRQTDEVIIN